MPSVASSAPEILIAHSAAATRHIRLGSGGVMLPNHAPLRVAENFHTLEALYPGRIDLGIGRAPAGMPDASRALRAVRGGLFAQLLDEQPSYSTGYTPGGYDAFAAQPEGGLVPPPGSLGSS